MHQSQSAPMGPLQSGHFGSLAMLSSSTSGPFGLSDSFAGSLHHRACAALSLSGTLAMLESMGPMAGVERSGAPPPIVQGWAEPARRELASEGTGVVPWRAERSAAAPSIVQGWAEPARRELASEGTESCPGARWRPTSGCDAPSGHPVSILTRARLTFCPNETLGTMMHSLADVHGSRRLVTDADGRSL